jgi:two-component system, NarL family, sensor kinase
MWNQSGWWGVTDVSSIGSRSRRRKAAGRCRTVRAPHRAEGWFPLPPAGPAQQNVVVTDGAPAPRPLRIVPALAVVSTVLIVAGVGSMVVRGRPLEAIYGHWMIHNGPAAVLCLWLGYLVLQRVPGHGGGRLLLALGAVAAAHVAVIALADARMMAAGVAHEHNRFEAVAPAELPLDASVPMWVSSWLWLPIVVMFIVVFPLLFPDGDPPGDRRRYALHLAAAAVVTLAVATSLLTWPGGERPMVMSTMDGAPSLSWALFALGGLLLAVAVVLAISTLIGRWRRAAGEERRRMRPVVITASALPIVAVGLWPGQAVWIPAVLLALYALLGTYALVIARYRLHDVELVVSRAVVAAVLAVTFTTTYLAIVVGIGHVVGRGRDNEVLPLVAVGIVAVAFEPVRRRVRRWVDRLIYGHDRDAYEVLSGIAEQLRSTPSTDGVLGEVAELLRRGTGAERIAIVATVRGAERVVAADGRSEREQAVWAIPADHEGEALGRIRVFARSSADLAPSAAPLLEDAAATIGVVLRNAQLTADLQEQVRALQRAGERLVVAHDEARRELERDIHDGAQARLIALKIRLGIAERRAAGREDPELAALIGSMSEEVDEAVRSLRELGRGLRPSVLEGAGVAAALRSEARHLALDVRVDDHAVHRHDPAVEAAVYFACLEAIQNAAKHGRASTVHVELSNGDGVLEFRVTDDGVGFDAAGTAGGSGLTNLRDRLTSLGGDASVQSSVGAGTTVAGRIPVQPLVSER